MSKIAVALAFATAAFMASANPALARNYDCSKAGNANKAVCKGKAPAPNMAPAMAPASTSASMARPRVYDCTKTLNRFRAQCRASAATAPARSLAPAVASAAPVQMRGGDKATNAGGPNGATAQCKDGTYSHSMHHSGTCSGHHGVATWY